MRKLLPVLLALLVAGLAAPIAHAAPGDRVLVYGDSLTAEAKPYIEGFVAGVGHTRALVRGAPGGATCDLFDLMGYDAHHEHPAVVVLQFSGNNLTRCMQDARGKALQGDAWLAKYRADTIAPKRIRRVKLFGGGELNRLIVDALRRAEGKPLSTPQIAAAIIEVKGYGHEAKPALCRRVRANLSYLMRQRGAVDKIGNRLTARWRLRPDTAGPLWDKAVD